MKNFKEYAKISEDKKEKIAKLAHDQWSNWMKYLFGKGKKNKDGSFTIAKESVDRWERQMNTPYDKLSEKEKDSDRKEADKFLKELCGE